MKATICAAGGRVHIEPVAGGDSVRLEVTTDGGTTAAVLLDLSAGGAVLFMLENALEVVDVATVRAMVSNAERAAVRSIAPDTLTEDQKYNLRRVTPFAEWADKGLFP